MKRRAFITLLGGAAAWPLAARAQQAERVHRIGVIVPFPESVITGWFEQLSRLGFAEGRNLAVDRRGIGASYEQFPVVAAELASARVDAIVCAGDASIRAAQAATQTIPIIGATDDMVGSGLAASLARPGGNTTGVSLLARELDGRRLELLFELLPEARRVAVLADSQTTGERQLDLLRTASRARAVELSIHAVARGEDVAPAVEAAKAAGAQALNVLFSPVSQSVPL
jgi:putative ABC transport system substrate-binding protein